MENLDTKIEKISIPEVQFELPTAEEEADTLVNFCFGKMSGGLDWSVMVYKTHPKLKERLAGLENEEEFREICLSYAKDYIKEHQTELEGARERFQKSWEEIAETFLTKITEDFETDLPEDIKSMKASVSIVPICPRYLDRWSFNVCHDANNDRMRQICIHEIIHFLYFKKWLEVFLGYNKRTFNSPYSEWILSEILVAPIINNNKTIQEIIHNYKTNVYRQWQHATINGKTLLEYFGDIYKEHEEGKISFADFLKKSWQEYQNNSDIIEAK